MGSRKGVRQNVQEAGRVKQVLRSGRVVAVGAVALLAATAADSASATGFIFDWELNTDTADVKGLPFLDNRLSTDLRDALLAGDIQGVKVRNDLTDATEAYYDAALVGRHIFADFEVPSSLGDTNDRTADLVSRFPGSTVGNFALTPLNAGFGGTGVTMSNARLYPGSGFPDPAAEGGASLFPTTTASLFGEPLKHLTETIAANPTTKHVPWTTRFNNSGNPVLDNDPAAAAGIHEYAYESDDLLSRGDFSALVSHYRLRGASGLALFLPGHMGYTKAQMHEDVLAGWNRADEDIEALLGGSTTQTDFLVRRPGGVVSTVVESDGAFMSGFANDDQMVLIVSNLDDGPLRGFVEDGTGGKAFLKQVGQAFSADQRILLSPLDHESFEFESFTFGPNEFWFLTTNEEVFDDDVRAGIGVPEPSSSLALATIGLLVGLNRPRKQAKG